MRQKPGFEITFSGYFDSKYAYGRENGHITKERILKNYEVELYIRNGGEAIIDDKRYKICANRVLVGKPGQKRHSKLNFQAYYIHINITECVLKKYLDSLPSFFEIYNVILYTDIFSKLSVLHEKDFPGKELCVGKLLYELVYLLYKDVNTVKIQDDRANNYELLEKARTFIKENYSSHIKLEDISSSVNLSPVYFHKLFTEYYGESPIAYLRETRLSNAKALLSTTDYSSDKITELCGFSSQSYFNYFFKQKVKMTPSQFREKELKKYEI